MSFAIPYTLKRIIAQFLMPVPLVFEVFVLGWAVSRFTRFKRAGAFFKAFAGCLFLAFGHGCGESFLYRQERLFPPLEPTPGQREALRGAYVVVLGQAIAAESDLPVRYRCNATMQQRLLEGVRVAQLIPGSRLLVSLPGPAAARSKDSFLEEFVGVSGLPIARIAKLAGARDTSDEVRLVQERAGTNALVLVTSAAHMPRAMRLFSEVSLKPVPAPCAFQTLARPRAWGWASVLLPTGGGFTRSEAAAYEWLGSHYEKLRNWQISE